MRKHRTVQILGIVIIAAALVYLVLGVIGAISLGGSGLGEGWSSGWRGWLTIPIFLATCLGFVALLVFGALLYFLAKIDANLAEAQQRFARAAAQPAAVVAPVALRPVSWQPSSPSPPSRPPRRKLPHPWPQRLSRLASWQPHITRRRSRWPRPRLMLPRRRLKPKRLSSQRPRQPASWQPNNRLPRWRWPRPRSRWLRRRLRSKRPWLQPPRWLSPPNSTRRQLEVEVAAPVVEMAAPAVEVEVPVVAAAARPPSTTPKPCERRSLPCRRRLRRWTRQRLRRRSRPKRLPGCPARMKPPGSPPRWLRSSRPSRRTSCSPHRRDRQQTSPAGGQPYRSQSKKDGSGTYP